MFRGTALLGVVMFVCAGMAVALAADPPMKQAKPKAEAPKPPRVYAPYHDLGLDAEQSMAVGTIQAEYRAKIAALEEEMDAKIVEHLTEDQLAALEKKEADRAAKRKAAYERAYAKRKAEAAKEKSDE